MSDAPTETANGASTGKIIAIVILVAVVSAIIVTLAQELLLHQTRTAVTGGMVGAISAVVAVNLMKKKSS